MKAAFLILLAFALAGCCRKPISTSFAEKHSDSVRVERVYIERVRDSLIYVPVPVESHRKEGIKADSSHLETSVARSSAWIDGDGHLGHSLENKPVSLSAAVQIKDTETVIDTVAKKSKETKEAQVFRERYVPGFFWFCFAFTLAIVLVGIISLIVWINRRFGYLFTL